MQPPDFTTPTDRLERIALNEAMFREANERIAGWPEHRERERFNILCECADSTCLDRIAATGNEYEAVRRNAMRFLVLRGHEVDEAERVVEDHGHYLVVEKRENVRAIVEETDPRS
jgi:hypothetical protein